jgi:hypothetical protein
MDREITVINLKYLDSFSGFGGKDQHKTVRKLPKKGHADIRPEFGFL